MKRISLSEFADRLDEIIPVIMKEFSQRHVNELYKGKITLPQFIIMTFLEKHGQAKMNELAGFMKVTTAAMTGMIERLVKAGYVRRVFDPKDRRIIRAGLSKKGTGLIKKVVTQRRQMILDIFGKISEAEREDYLRILTHIHEILTEQKADMK